MHVLTVTDKLTQSNNILLNFSKYCGFDFIFPFNEQSFFLKNSKQMFI